ncbi:hypothetical protein PIB30_029080 [Stylosanthes scabra]|uniref:Uncharacterized protein n=1 Tax=Stylosanthes scabra TaxID=79078 RepID=A0ABU6SBD1_9FABA|nr:hypothetical protein [Stylosanthes scabra]
MTRTEHSEVPPTPNCLQNDLIRSVSVVHSRRSLKFRASLKILVVTEVCTTLSEHFDLQRSSSQKHSDGRPPPLPDQNNNDYCLDDTRIMMDISQLLNFSVGGGVVSPGDGSDEPPPRLLPLFRSARIDDGGRVSPEDNNGSMTMQLFRRRLDNEARLDGLLTTATEKFDGGSNDVSIGDVSLSLKSSLFLRPLTLLRDGDGSHQVGAVASLSFPFSSILHSPSLILCVGVLSVAVCVKDIEGFGF